jgi:uncharacterized cupin superfamily protein
MGAGPGGRETTFALHVEALALGEAEPLEPSTVLRGNPVVREAILSSSEEGRIVRGVWEIDEGVVTDTEEDEVFVVIRGRATIEVEDGPTLEVSAGDVCVLAKGARTTWTIHERLRKVFQVTRRLTGPPRCRLALSWLSC